MTTRLYTIKTWDNIPLEGGIVTEGQERHEFSRFLSRHGFHQTIMQDTKMSRWVAYTAIGKIYFHTREDKK